MFIKLKPPKKPEPVKPSIPEQSPSIKKDPLEVSRGQIKIAVKNYLIEKSKENKQVTYKYTTSAIREVLDLKESKEINDDIWTIALNISPDYSIKQTAKTIYFKL